MNLYELTVNYKNLAELLDNPDVPKEVIQSALNDVQEDINKKAENIIKLTKNIDAEIEALKNEEKRLSDRRKSLEKKSVSLKEYLQSQMAAINTSKIKTNLFTISIQKNPISVNIQNEACFKILHKKYLVIQPSTINKKLLLDDLKAGIEVEGAELMQTESLRVR